ncbi:hypothetical protein NDA14_002826 [Ustilago hordei]|nr:hypothetical protein NDA10_004778 [Ustilago hordei]KAJ1600698.1 hypothetical protein NDA14_002826 [Ustilago hordei]
MSNLNYSNYDNFVKVIQDLLPCLPKILQNQFNQEIANKTYGNPTAPKDGLLLKYAMEESDGEQIISPLSILIECTSNLYKAMHSLSPFATNEGWDANHILDLKIEGSVKSIWNTEQFNHPVKSKALASARSNTPIFESNVPYTPNVTNHHLIGCDATPGPTPELNAITNHHLKTLSSLNEKMQWDENDLLVPRMTSVHAWQCKIFAMLCIVPFAQNVLDHKITTFEDADSILSSIIMWSFSKKLCTEYFAEHGDKPLLITVDLFDWAMDKCKAHSSTKEYELQAVILDLHWDQVGTHAYDFLIKWEAHVSELHMYLQDPWKPDYCYRTLKQALPSDQNALFNSVFILHKKVHGKEQTAESISDVLCQCYELAAENIPTSCHHMAEESELITLQATTLINCWACRELGHAANCCPNNAAHAHWKEGRVKVQLKGCANACIVLPLMNTREE